MSDGRNDLEQLKALACDRLEELAEEAMGPPNPGSWRRREWRWGTKGGRSLVVRGPRRGLYYDHEADSGGSVIDMVMFGLRCSLPAAVTWLRSRLGLGASDPILASEQMRAARAQRQAEAEAKAAKDAARRITQARRIWRGAGRFLEASAADVYLRVTRRIPRPASGWPESVRFDRRRNALVFAVTDAVGAVVAVHLIYLTRGGQKLGEAERRRRHLPNQKMTDGVRSAGLVRLPGDPNGPLQCAEGMETGLSAWVATGYETWIVLGTMANLDLPAGRTVIICAEDDPRFSVSAKRLRTALAGWRCAGLDVVIVTPWQYRKYDKSDLNDTMQVGGVDAVRARICRALGTISPQTARLPVHEVRQQIDRMIGEFFDRAREFHAAGEGDAPVLAISAGTGSGKSSYALQHAYRVAGDVRILYAVPRVALGEELAVKQRQQGRSAEVRRGREQDDPKTPGKKMCLNLEAVKDALEVGANVEDAACHKAMMDGSIRTCPFRPLCGYCRQDAEQAEADVVFLPHNLLTMSPPESLDGPAILVCDENPLGPFLIGHEDDGILISLDALATNDEIVDHEDRVGAQVATAELRGLRRQIIEAVRDATCGPVLREMLLVVGLTAADCQSAHALEWKRNITPAMYPGMPAEDRRLAKRPAKNNRLVRCFGRMWKALEALLADGGPAASGWIEIVMADTEIGLVKALRLKGRRHLGKEWHVPTLLLDATLQPELLRYIWPRLEVAGTISLEVPPAVRVMQVDDRAFALSMLRQLEDEHEDDAAASGGRRKRRQASAAQAEARKKEASRRRRCLRDLHAWLVRTALDFAPEQVLIIPQLKVESALRELGNFPPNVTWGHHNGIAGRDDCKHARAVIVIGRTQPKPRDVEQMAEALTGSAVTRLSSWYPRVDAERQMRDGRILPAEADRHPDPIAEAFRWRICEGELVQACGRARWGDRAKNNPLDIFLVTDVPIPFPVGQLISADDLQPTLEDLMLAAGGVIFGNARHAFAAYGNGAETGLWPSWAAARQAFARQQRRSVTSPYMGISVGGCHTPPAGEGLVSYQLAGAGQNLATARFSPAVCGDPRGFLTKQLGPLAVCEVIWPPGTDPHPPAPSPPSPKPLRLPGEHQASVRRLAVARQAVWPGSDSKGIFGISGAGERPEGLSCSGENALSQ